MATAGHGVDGDAELAAMERFRQMVPELGGNYKGAHGKVAVVGGCAEFTGAPFFAAMSALRVGADMAYVICTPSAAVPIKSYSPELMVLPYLPEGPPGHEEPAVQAEVDAAVGRILPWLLRASALVVGPGLGADPWVCAAAAGLVREARARGLPLLVDGSALTHIVAKDASLVAGYRPCVLTPNVAELGRIGGVVGIRLPGRMSDEWLEHAPRVAAAFGGPILLAKGEADLVCGPQDAALLPEGAAAAAATTTAPRGAAAAAAAAAAPAAQAETGATIGARAEAAGAEAGAGVGAGPRPLLVCRKPGSLRRCGGQGDVLAGTVAAFLGWAAKHRSSAPQSSGTTQPPSNRATPAPAAGTGTGTGTGAAAAQQQHDGDGGANGGGGLLGTADVAACAYAGSVVVRAAARAAFVAGERSMVAGDIIPLLHPAFKRMVQNR